MSPNGGAQPSSSRAAYLALLATSARPAPPVSTPARPTSAPPRYVRSEHNTSASADRRSFNEGTRPLRFPNELKPPTNLKSPTRCNEKLLFYTPKASTTNSFLSVQPRRIPILIFLCANFFGAIGFIAHGVWDSVDSPSTRAAVTSILVRRRLAAVPVTASRDTFFREKNGGQTWVGLLATQPLAAKFLGRDFFTQLDERIYGEWPANNDCPGDFRLDNAFAICTALDQHRSVRNIADLNGHANENGAYSQHNQKYDSTGAGKWYIEEQYYGFLFIQAGLAFNNSEAARIGMKIYDWGFDQQREDGSFDCPDVYHSAGFFMESAARAALLLKSSRWAAHPVFQQWLRKAEKHIAAMAAWFVQPDIERIGWKNDAVHAHRRYLTGTALGMAGLLTNNQTLILKSIEYIRSGLEMQDPAGFNYERQGYDCSYQGIGLVYAARYYLYVAPHMKNGSETEEIRSRLLEAGRRGTDWLMMRVDERGVLNATGNTRTGSAQEVGRNGKPKALARKDVFHALLYWSWVLGDPEVELVAWRVEWERTQRLRDRRCDCRGVFRWGLKNAEIRKMVQ